MRSRVANSASWAGRRYSPCAAPDPPDGILLDITGCEGLFGGEMALAKNLHRRVRASGMAVQIAIAETAGCAHAVARHVPAGRPVVIEPGKARTAMVLLPVSSFRIEPGVASELVRMGFDRLNS